MTLWQRLHKAADRWQGAFVLGVILGMVGSSVGYFIGLIVFKGGI